MTAEKFATIRSIFDDTLQFDDSDSKLLSLTRSMPNVFQTAIDLYTSQLREVGDLKLLKDKIYSEGFKHYKTRTDREYTPKEIEILMNSNEQFIAASRTVNEQEMYARYLEHVITNIKSISYHINNYISVKKFFQGDNR